MRKLVHSHFLICKFVAKMTNLSLAFPENQSLVELWPNIQVSFQHTKQEDFNTHKCIENLAYAVILKPKKTKYKK